MPTEDGKETTYRMLRLSPAHVQLGDMALLDRPDRPVWSARQEEGRQEFWWVWTWDEDLKHTSTFSPAFLHVMKWARGKGFEWILFDFECGEVYSELPTFEWDRKRIRVFAQEPTSGELFFYLDDNDREGKCIHGTLVCGDVIVTQRKDGKKRKKEKFYHLRRLPYARMGNFVWRFGKPIKILNACMECGSKDLQVTAWLEMNTGEDTGGDPPTDQCFCTKCDDETRVEEHEVPLEEL